MKYFVSLFFFGLGCVYAAALGSVVAIEGNVKKKSSDSLQKQRVHLHESIKEGDMLISASDAHAVLRLEDNSTIILDASSSIRFLSSSEIEQPTGRVYYKITSKQAKDSLHVTTDFAVIGIKGTTFIVKADANKEILLQEGLIGISAIKKQFEDYKEQINEAFEQYKQEQMRGFEAFDLNQSNKVSFDGDSVQEDPFNTEDTSEFDYFEDLLNTL